MSVKTATSSLRASRPAANNISHTSYSENFPALGVASDSTSWLSLLRTFATQDADPKTNRGLTAELVKHPLFWNVKQLNPEDLSSFLKLLDCFISLPEAVNDKRLPALLRELKNKIPKHLKSHPLETQRLNSASNHWRRPFLMLIKETVRQWRLKREISRQTLTK